MGDTRPVQAEALPIRAESHIRMKKLLPALLLPLFFIVAFPLSYVSALHMPIPRHVELTLVGPDSVISPVAKRLVATGAYAVTRTDQVTVARSSVAERDADGAILVDAKSAAGPVLGVTTYVGSGGGVRLAAVVEALGTSIAKRLGTTANVVDVAPLGSGDPLGIDLFYFLIVCSMGGYLVIIAMIQVAPGTRLRTRWAVGVTTAIATPIIVYGLTSIFDGDLHADLWTTVSVLGIASIYVLACSGTAIVMTQLLGKLATFGVMAVVVFLNFPAAGGAMPAALLPAFWRGVHSFYFGSGAFESFRSLVYFHGAGLMRWLPQLLIWTGVAILLTALLELVHTVRAQRTELASLRADSPAGDGRLATHMPVVPHATRPSDQDEVGLPVSSSSVSAITAGVGA